MYSIGKLFDKKLLGILNISLKEKVVHGWTPLLLAARHGHSKVAKAGRWVPMGRWVFSWVLGLEGEVKHRFW